MFLRVFILLYFVFLSSLSLAGGFTCENFEEAVELYKADPESIDLEIDYAICSVLKGDRQDGLSRLYHIAKKHNDVFSAFFLAEYIQYGGDFKFPIDGEKIDEAIDAYFNVLLLIDVTPYYPKGYELYEYYVQMELHSYYNVPWLYMQKFAAGAGGLYRELLLNSPSYKGNRDLNTYPKYSPYTLESLENVIEFANRCIALPKKSYFRQSNYKDTQKICRILKDAAKALLPLEEKRLELLANESCRRDVLKCQEHNELFNGTMRSIYIQSDAKMDAIVAPYQQQHAQTASAQTVSYQN